MVTWKDKLNIKLGIFLLLLGTSSLLTLGFTHSNFIHSSASLNYICPLFNYNPPENFMFLISSNKDIDQLILENFNCTIK